MRNQIAVIKRTLLPENGLSENHDLKLEIMKQFSKLQYILDEITGTIEQFEKIRESF